MKFGLTPERHTELEQNVRELEQWVRQLEELDLEEYEPLLVPPIGEPPRHD